MNEEKSNLIAGILFFICSAFVASFGPPVFKYVIQEYSLSKNNVVLYFLLFGGLSMIPFSINDLKFKNCSTIFSWKIIGKLLLIGALMPIIYYCYTSALMVRSATETVPLVRLDTLFVVILSSLLLREKVASWSKLLLSIAVCLSGLLIFLDISPKMLFSSFSHPFIIFVLVAALCLALQAVARRKVQQYKIIKNETIVCISMIVGAILMFFYLIIIQHKIIIPNFTEILWLLFLGFFTISLASYFDLKAYNVAQSISKIYFLNFLRPIFVAVIAFYLLGEKNFNYVNLVIGFAIIVLGIYIAEKQLQGR